MHVHVQVGDVHVHSVSGPKPSMRHWQYIFQTSRREKWGGQCPTLSGVLVTLVGLTFGRQLLLSTGCGVKQLRGRSDVLGKRLGVAISLSRRFVGTRSAPCLRLLLGKVFLPLQSVTFFWLGGFLVCTYIYIYTYSQTLCELVSLCTAAFLPTCTA